MSKKKRNSRNQKRTELHVEQKSMTLEKAQQESINFAKQNEQLEGEQPRSSEHNSSAALKPQRVELEAVSDGGESVNEWGLVFKCAREAAGLSIEEVASKLRLTSAKIASIEASNLNALGAAVYARGYLSSFARLLKLDDSVWKSALANVVTNTPETSIVNPNLGERTRKPSRFGNGLLYIGLTAVLIWPTVHLVRSSISTTPAPLELRNLDSANKGTEQLVDEAQNGQIDLLPVESAPTDALAYTFNAGFEGALQQAASVLRNQSNRESSPVTSSADPVMASLAPVGSFSDTQSSKPSENEQIVVLSLQRMSWVELTGIDGVRLEYALLPAGTKRSYRIAGKAELRIGNASNAELVIDGRSVDLKPHSRSNVATLNVGRE